MGLPHRPQMQSLSEKVRRGYRRPVAVLVLLTIFGIHVLQPEKFKLDWPGVALLGGALALFLIPKLELLLPFVKKLKVGEAEIELRERVSALALSVEVSEQNPPEINTKKPVELLLAEARYERLVNTTVESHILDIAVKNKKAALIRLAIEIETEIIQLHGTVGLRNQSRARTVREFLDELVQQGTVSADLRAGLLEFWEVRNRVVHGQVSDDSILASTVDSGIRLLRILKSIPRSVYVVVEPSVPLYVDAACTKKVPGLHGVILEITEPDGVKSRMIFPAAREFVVGEIVGWDWDMSKVHDGAFYLDPTTGHPKSAWGAALAFIGKPQLG